MLLGCDISHHNGNLKKINFDFCIAKATQGTHFTDTQFKQNMSVLNTYYPTIKKGAYHYVTTANGIVQAGHFIDTLSANNCIGNTLIALDFEGEALCKKGQDALFDMINKIKMETGVTPLIYMSESTLKRFDWRGFTDCGLWIAKYKNKEGIIKDYRKVHPFTYPTAFSLDNQHEYIYPASKGLWPFIAIRQFTSEGYLGITDGKGPIDLDVAYMSKEAWDKYAKSE